MLDARMPDLTFPTLEYGEYETPLARKFHRTVGGTFKNVF